MSRIFEIILLLIFFVSFLFSEEKKDVFEELNLAFKYGTKSEIVSGLSLYNKNNLTPDSRKKYMVSMKELLKLELLDLDVNNKIVFVIQQNNFKQFEFYYQNIFDRLMKEDSMTANNKRLLVLMLDAMIESKNSQFLKNFKKIYEDFEGNMTNKGFRTDDIMVEIIRGFRVFGENIFSEDLKKKYTETDNVRLKEELIRSIAKRKNVTDIGYFKEQLEDEQVSKNLKFVILVELSNYKNNPEAIIILKEYSQEKDEALKARAIYALSKILSQKESRILFDESIRSDVESTRLQALDIAENIMNDEILKILEYKLDHDPSIKVQRRVKIILDKIKENKG